MHRGRADPEKGFRQTSQDVLIAGAAYGKDQRHSFDPHPAGDDAEHVHGSLIELLDVVDHPDQRLA